jgi:hypothetical protein
MIMTFLSLRLTNKETLLTPSLDVYTYQVQQEVQVFHEYYSV